MPPIRSLLAALLLAAPALASAMAPLSPDLSSLPSVPLHRAPAAVIGKALRQVEGKSRPLAFAVTAALPLGLDAGLWDEAEPGVARWRMRVASSGALDLAVQFSKFELPADAALWIYDDAGALVQGPYTSADRNAAGGLWTALVPGAAAVLELRVPAAARDAVQLQLAQVQHAFIDIAKVDETVAAKSGSCNIDVICTDGNNWRPEIRSAARITLTVGGSSFLCSGQMVNNTSFNRAPLFLTANHCGIDNATVANSVVVYWNYQAPVCGGAQKGSLAQNQSGSALLAGDVGTDFTLLRLNAVPPAGYNVYYAGWNASGAVPQSGVAIHHPSGDEKRISTYTAPAVAGNVCIEGSTSNCTREVKAWQVNWTRGTTEEGSSGGGLWDQNHRLVGTLSGGAASCSTPGGDDYFARLAAGFTANSASNGQLKAWLDPTSTGANTVTGLDTALTANADSYRVAQDSAATTLDVLANDTSGIGSISLSAVGAGSSGGTVSASGNRVSYRPASGFQGTETFSYTATDGATSQSATVTITVTETGSTPDDSGGGGGSLGWLSLLVLGAAATRRRRAPAARSA